jgi:hypothetical protein
MIPSILAEKGFGFKPDSSMEPVTGSINGSCKPPIDWAVERGCMLRKTCNECVNNYYCGNYTNIVVDCEGHVKSYDNGSSDDLGSVLKSLTQNPLFFIILMAVPLIMIIKMLRIWDRM